MRRWLIGAAALVPALHGPGVTAASEGDELLGRPAPPLEADAWIGSPGLTLDSLKGKVVLIRWFTATDCPYCTASAPALNQLHHDFKDRGLVVIGMYHHKRAEPLEAGQVKDWARSYGFEFPVAVDRDWRTLRRWWLDGRKRRFTSVSFLLDREGIIRRIHPGGTLALGTKDYAAMRSAIEGLLPPHRPVANAGGG